MVSFPSSTKEHRSCTLKPGDSASSFVEDDFYFFVIQEIICSLFAGSSMIFLFL